jgi:hypothetical protein
MDSLRKLGVIFCGIFFVFNAMADRNTDIDHYKHSWTAKVSALQRQIDINAPFNQETFIGTHNSFNSASYAIPLIRYVDPNHTLSIYEQLEMGMRSLEFDAHWYLSRHGKKDILLCHGQDNHLGCSVDDRPFAEGLEELRGWLAANPGEIVLLYIDRHADGHEPYLASLLDQYVGSYIYKPDRVRSGADLKSCVSIPNTLTKAELLKSGKQLLVVVKGCDGSNPDYEDQAKYPYIWNDYVFAGIGDIPNHPFTFLDSSLNANFKPYPECGVDMTYNKDVNHTSLWRVLEDRTELSNLAGKGSEIVAADIPELLKCDINWVAMDMLTVDDARLKAIIWSWAPDYPNGNGECAVYKRDLGIENKACAEMASGYACEQEQTHAFRVVANDGAWQQGEKACQALAGEKWHFSMPINAAYMQLMKNSMQDSSLTEIWVNYKLNSQQQWVANNRDN